MPEMKFLPFDSSNQDHRYLTWLDISSVKKSKWEKSRLSKCQIWSNYNKVRNTDVLKAGPKADYELAVCDWLERWNHWKNEKIIEIHQK